MWFAPLVLLVAGLAPAAPVPADLKADKERLEQLWGDLASKDPVVRTRAVFDLIDHPKAVPFLAEKARPVKASAEQLTAWVKDLDSDDEKVWKAAFEQLNYFDPRLGLTLPEQIELVTTHDGRRRLVGVLRGGIPEPHDGAYSTELTLGKWRPGGVMLTYSFAFRTPGSNGAGSRGFPVEPVAEMRPAAWRQTALAALVLDRVGTAAAREAFDRIVAGHPDALPTRTAAAARLDRLAPPPVSGFDFVWPSLLYDDPVETTRWALALADRPDLVRGLKAKLPAIKATKEQMTEWLKALDSTDPKVWQPAYEKVIYFRPRIALGWQEQIEAVTTDHGRAALFRIYYHDRYVPSEFTVHPNCRLSMQDGEKRLVLTYPTKDPKHPEESDYADAGPLDTMTCHRWERVRVAVLALERAGTPAAKAVLKQLADGHPDILPTKEAKAALGRLTK